jgi:hypothetical protein
MDSIAPENTTLTPSIAEGDFLDQLTKRCPSPPCIFSPQPSLTLEFLDTTESVHGGLLVVVITLMAMVSLYVAYIAVFPNL